MGTAYDAVVVGAGPNGLAAAVEIARNGKTVLVVEGAATIGGGCRTAEVTLPGFRHDVCAAIHPLGAGSPYFARLPLHRYGLEWVHPEIEVTHPLDGGDAVALYRSMERTSSGLAEDGGRYARLMGPLADRSAAIFGDILGPLLRLPRHPLATARFGLAGVLPVSLLVRRFRSTAARALFAGLGAHSVVPLTRPFTAGVAVSLAMAGHAVGWPMARGGSQAVVDALAAYLTDLGGEIVTGTRVDSLDDLPRARTVLADVTPAGLAGLAQGRIDTRTDRRLRRARRRGPGVFKVDWALSGPVPWADPHSAGAATVHLGGTYEEIAAAEDATYRGEVVDRPFVLVAQQSPFDPTRAPAGRHTAWGYCHVPTGSDADMTRAIEDQLERFAPGFGDLILERSVMGPAAYEAYNPNYAGGDITGGELSLRRLVGGVHPYDTPLPDVYLCSASTPPGAGVHGMCGYHAARRALRRSLRG
jgi:phytoene dehydrogenase-like protein